MQHRLLFGGASAALAIALATLAARADEADNFQTATRIKHLVVIFQENVSFDHYFGTYPHAENNTGETPFQASKRTPTSINTLLTPLDVNHGFTPLTGVDLMNNNPNANPNAPIGPNNSKRNGQNDAANPFRLAQAQALTQDQMHAAGREQAAYNDGNVDGFPAWTGKAGKPPAEPPAALTKGLVMSYFDGNTVTALWNYAQHFAMNDNAFQAQFGPSTPGAINLISGQTSGLKVYTGNPRSISLGNRNNEAFGDASGNPDTLTLIGDPDPLLDICSDSTPNADQVTFTGRNVGDLLNTKGISWGWFQGGFHLLPTATDPTGCDRHTPPTAEGTVTSPSPDYIPHHEPFQYYASTRNPDHLRPSSVAAIGHTDAANHQYDTHDFFDALDAGHLPAVTFLKAPAFQDGHAGHSDPIDEQKFIVTAVNKLQQSRYWRNMAVIITYDDSDGWYDHQMPPIVNPSSNPHLDTLNGPDGCKRGLQQRTDPRAQPLNGTAGTPVWGRCGYGARIPFLVVSPFAKRNFVDHTLIDQTSVLRFIEHNWLGDEFIQPGGSFDTIAGTIENMFDFSLGGQPRQVLLDETTGQVTSVSGEPDDGN
jgi:phospholipase C